MKAIFTVTLTIYLISFSAIASTTPNKKSIATTSFSTLTAEDIFGKINVHRKQAGVSLNWTTTENNDISAFLIERSWDGNYFETIDQVEVNNGMNRYQDNDVFPGHLYYRIVAVMNDGTEIASAVEMVRIVKNG